MEAREEVDGEEDSMMELERPGEEKKKRLEAMAVEKSGAVMIDESSESEAGGMS